MSNRQKCFVVCRDPSVGFILRSHYQVTQCPPIYEHQGEQLRYLVGRWKAANSISLGFVGRWFARLVQDLPPPETLFVFIVVDDFIVRHVPFADGKKSIGWIFDALGLSSEDSTIFCVVVKQDLDSDWRRGLSDVGWGDIVIDRDSLFANEEKQRIVRRTARLQTAFVRGWEGRQVQFRSLQRERCWDYIRAALLAAVAATAAKITEQLLKS